ncbi:MAG: hypothetical protein AAFY06_11975 [Pseudomonadota bacterium]
MEQDVLHQSPELQRVSCLGLDEFERGVLKVIRQFLVAHESPETQAWHHAFLISVERWGEAVGLAAAHGLSKFVKAVLRFRADGLVFQDPLSTQARDYATDDEALMMAVLHYMRRDQTSYARDAVAALTMGQMDPDVIRTGLCFASRFAAGSGRGDTRSRAAELRVVT